MKMKKKDQKLFWKLLDRLHPKKDVYKNCISGERWNKHFKNILRDKIREPKYPHDSLEEGPLDYAITSEELSKASYVLKPNKSSGYDSISNEMISCLLEVQPELILKLSNSILIKNPRINIWEISMITPIFKNGSKMNPGDYRGISVQSCLSKLFSSVLNQRLLQYVTEKDILRKEQLGFIAGNRTSDAHLILQTLIQLNCHKKGQKIFSCFVDFKKAFDSIPRDILLEKILNIGVSGKFFNVLKTLYLNDSCCVKLDGKLTNTFVANQGVKQGCILSPLLFNIFLADITEQFTNEACNPIKIDDSNSLGSLIWADDILLLSESEEGLRCMLQNLSQYSEKNGMEINIQKTKCMIFNKSGKFFKRSFKLKDETIFTTNSYKYLGFMVTPSGELTTGLNDLKDRALRAYYKLKNKMGHYFRLYPDVTICMVDALIKPILLYNSDFWGCLKMPKNNPLENTHMRFCKDLLGVQKQTTNIGVLLELGRVPIMLYAKKNCIKNWSRINTTGKANDIVLSINNISINNSLNWTQSVIDCLNRTGIGSESRSTSVHKTTFKRMTDIFHQEAFVEIGKDTSKLRTFGKIKTKIGIEKYLTCIKSINIRTDISRMRLSNHDLMIEKGRHLKLKRDQRVCPFCPSLVETEEHFILFCKTFSQFRRELYREVENYFQGFEEYTTEHRLKLLLGDEKIVHITGTYLSKALYVRRFLIGKHKNTI